MFLQLLTLISSSKHWYTREYDRCIRETAWWAWGNGLTSFWHACDLSYQWSSILALFGIQMSLYYFWDVFQTTRCDSYYVIPRSLYPQVYVAFSLMVCRPSSKNRDALPVTIDLFSQQCAEFLPVTGLLYCPKSCSPSDVSYSHPDVQRFKPTALRLAKA